jgi:hypothetical protein
MLTKLLDYPGYFLDAVINRVRAVSGGAGGAGCAHLVSADFWPSTIQRRI